jgi:hypothetical protein
MRSDGFKPLGDLDPKNAVTFGGSGHFTPLEGDRRCWLQAHLAFTCLGSDHGELARKVPAENASEEF